MMQIFTKTRVDTILIWGHGMRYFDEILGEIRRNKNFNIVMIQKHQPKNIKKFVKEIYSYDYAPFWHLKSKTEYLLKFTGEVCFIFVESLNPVEDYFGKGRFRHKELVTLKEFKESLRDKYNPYENEERTHNHVIHATDSQEQTNKMLEYLGYKKGIKLFNNLHTPINMPYYLDGYRNYRFKILLLDEIFCNIASGETQNNFTLKTIKIQQSPQYKGITENMSLYRQYIDKYLGWALYDDYNLEKYSELSNSFEYLAPPHQTSFIIVRKVEGKFVILDGLHRASNCVKQGYKEVKVCLVSKYKNQ